MLCIFRPQIYTSITLHTHCPRSTISISCLGILPSHDGLSSLDALRRAVQAMNRNIRHARNSCTSSTVPILSCPSGIPHTRLEFSLLYSGLVLLRVRTPLNHFSIINYGAILFTSFTSFSTFMSSPISRSAWNG